MVAIAGWAHLTLSVREHDRSVRWYREVLDFRPLASETTDRWAYGVRRTAGTAGWSSSCRSKKADMCLLIPRPLYA